MSKACLIVKRSTPTFVAGRKFAGSHARTLPAKSYTARTSIAYAFPWARVKLLTSASPSLCGTDTFSRRISLVAGRATDLLGHELISGYTSKVKSRRMTTPLGQHDVPFEGRAAFHSATWSSVSMQHSSQLHELSSRMRRHVSTSSSNSRWPQEHRVHADGVRMVRL